MKRALLGALFLLGATCAAPSEAVKPDAPPASSPRFDEGVTVRLVRHASLGSTLSFGLPLPPHAVSDPRTVRVEANGALLPARVDELLAEHDAAGGRSGARAILVQLPQSSLSGDTLDVTVRWRGGAQDPGAPMPARASYRSDGSYEAAEIVKTVVRTIAGDRLSEGPVVPRTLFVGKEPRALALFPPGYLAATRILGAQVTTRQAHDPARAGLRYLSDALHDYAGSAIYDEKYALNPDPESVPDPKENYEGWLYDRCATFLIAYTHTGEERFLRTAMRHCAYYASQIRLQPPNAGIFAGKPDPDPKYSHLRGLYAYYALTGDESALAAGRAIAELWLNDSLFVGPYRAGHMRGPEKLWTERLLGTSLEALYYGHRLTGEAKYLAAFKDLFAVAYRHLTGDAATLARINPGVSLPPQSCFIHSSLQQGEGNAGDPWCSGWMSELLIDPLLQFQEQTGDPRVDEVFIRLARFLRDVGSTYFRGDPLKDSFLQPSTCDNPDDTRDRRLLVPIYGAGLGADGQRHVYGEYEDYLHCPDATALTAVALRALKRKGVYDQNPIGPFKSEGESILQLHHELSFCAQSAFAEQARPKRDPSQWSAAELSTGAGDPAKFIRDNKIGYPTHSISPVRRLSWWFNTSLEQFSWLAEAGVEIRKLHPGRLQAPGCR